MNPGMLRRGDEVRLEISGSAFEGKAVARINGLVVFVEGGVPGDIVKARIVRTKRNHAEARIEGIESVEVPPVIGADDIYFYRNKMEYSFSDQEWLEELPDRPVDRVVSSRLSVKS